MTEYTYFKLTAHLLVKMYNITSDNIRSNTNIVQSNATMFYSISTCFSWSWPSSDHKYSI